MNITESIAKLEKLRDDHGELDLIITQSDDNVYSCDSISFEEVEDDDLYPEDYNMPKGFKFVNLNVFG